SAPNYIAADEYINSGKFGDINMVEMTWNVNQPGRWRLPKLVSEIRQEDTDWDRFLMNRPKVAWDPRKYLEFRLFWPYSSGIWGQDRKSTRLNSSHVKISYAVFCLKKKKTKLQQIK